MGKRSRLFASAAFPLLSLSLAFEPAAAAALREQPIAPLNNGIVGTTDANGSFEVAQQDAPAAQPEEEQLKKKHGEGEQGAPEGKKHEGQKPEGEGGEQQHQMKQAEPEGEQQQKPPKAERQQPAEQEQQKPEAKQPAAEAQPEPKKQRQQPAEEPQAQPEAKPEAKPQPKAAAPEAQPEAQPPKQKGKPQSEAKQPAEEQQPEAKQPAAEAQPEAKPEAKPEQKAKPGSKAQQPAATEKEAPAAGEPQKQEAQPEKQAQPEQNAKPKPQGETAAPAQQPAEQQPAGQPAKGHKNQPETQAQPEAQPGTPATSGAEQGQKPGADKTHGKQPQTQQQGEQPAANPQQPAQKGEQQGQPAQAQPGTPATGSEATQQPGKQPPANGAEAPAQGNAATPAPANGNAQQAGEIQVPPAEQVSPQELERRKKIAENPSSASGPVILPVENGSAVLDSQKGAVRRGEHLNNGQNPGGRGQGGQAGQGQVGQGQNGQGQAGQAQNAPGQQPPPAYSKPPTSDAEAQRAAAGNQQQPPVKMEAVTSEQGRRIDRRPDFAPPQGTTVQTIINQDNRTVVNVDNTYVVRHDDTERFVRGGERPTYEQLPRDRYRETIDQPDGDRVVTIRNRYGDIIQRSRIDARGREYVLFYSPELEDRPDNDDYYRDPGEDLPPMRLLIPLSKYIIDTASNRNADYYDFLREPPVEPVERIYSVNEVRYSARIRDKIRRIDLDTITFATGSSDIPMTQASTLRGVADGISKIIKNDPTETFLIEGHTDAVGSAQSNLILSDRRAESVANVLSDVYGIPAENLVTQGYGEQYLKVNTTGPSQENRRVTIRRITPLVRPVASNRQ
ncbi:OmpA family protein [Rhizobium sp. P38BS-XIX]|uniref:OmpA family protein n=1 Tax=Rhizobium sp. P38BS-XIX TaxID=2726740 RepID=UPI001456D7FB|nr:OmpA family protein [Rhizobium sp. P38BS-XIX]NLR96324.1 OmpA family protein [Rhizobium sp. P38BS-XIX]